MTSNYSNVLVYSLLLCSNDVLRFHRDLVFGRPSVSPPALTLCPPPKSRPTTTTPVWWKRSSADSVSCFLVTSSRMAYRRETHMQRHTGDTECCLCPCSFIPTMSRGSEVKVMHKESRNSLSLTLTFPSCLGVPLAVLCKRLTVLYYWVPIATLIHIS